MPAKYIQNFLHFFHRPFSRIMSQQQFRYLACGAFMAVTDVCLFALIYNVILHKNPIFIGNFKLEASLAAMWLPFPVGFFISYGLSRFVVFHETQLKHSTSLFRYSLLVATCFVLNSTLIHFFVDICKWNGIMSKILCTILIAGFSYFTQRYFTFKPKTEKGK